MFSMPSHYRQWSEAQLLEVDEILNASAQHHEVIIYRILFCLKLWFAVLIDDVRANMQNCGVQQ